MTAATTAIDLVSLRENTLGDLLYQHHKGLRPVPPAYGEAHSVTSVTRRADPGTLVPERLRLPIDWRVWTFRPCCRFAPSSLSRVILRTSRWLTSAAPPGMTGDIYHRMV